jgi:DNA-binding MarR family transcriptional regulator
MQEKPLDTDVMNLLRGVSLLVRRVRAAVSSHHLSWTQTMVMARLAKEGPATIADLARAEGVKPQSMGTAIAELKELGLVDRKPHPTDGRQMMIELTAQGIAVRKAASEEKRTWLTQAVAQLDEEEQRTLFAAGEIIQRLVEK